MREDNGSAVVEFVVLALPLFIPMALYLTVVNSQSQVAFDAHNLARQVARAYVTSPAENLTSSRITVVIDAFIDNVFKKHGLSSKPEVRIVCSNTPCLTPGAEVKAIVTIQDDSMKPSGYLRFTNPSRTRIIAQDTQVVDAWRGTS